MGDLCLLCTDVRRSALQLEFIFKGEICKQFEFHQNQSTLADSHFTGDTRCLDAVPSIFWEGTMDENDNPEEIQKLGKCNFDLSFIL
jgi:hypothetical protein